ncbi:MAG TPA: SIS domain-containing protein, partial [Candidatus Angelobacter sp.]|nr:SIS domain-containing protein [Candidatus Angelobacter sp.]
TLKECYENDGKILLCGNGGSSSDCDHIVGELMKGFVKKRPVSEALRQEFINKYPEDGKYLSDYLQGALPAISLTSQSALMTAFSNDVAADMVFAQQVYGYGREKDVLVALSTSGASKNVVQALKVADIIGMKKIGLTGRDGGQIKALCDTTIIVPWEETIHIQERHLPIYHALCLMLEEAFFTI